MCGKAIQKFIAFSAKEKLFSLNKSRTIFKAFVLPHFKYLPNVWMFHSQHTNKKINRLHERAFRTVKMTMFQCVSKCLIGTNVFVFTMKIFNFFMTEVTII